MYVQEATENFGYCCHHFLCLQDLHLHELQVEFSWSLVLPLTDRGLLLAGLTDKMRSDFNMMKDLAIHTRLPPEQRQRELGRLLTYIQK